MPKAIKKEIIIEKLIDIYNKEGDITSPLLQKYHISHSTIQSKFGSFYNALIETGLEFDEVKLNKLKKFSSNISKTKKELTDEKLINLLQDYYNKYGFPTVRKLDKNKDYPNTATYRKRFGSFKNALIQSNIEIPKNKERFFDREEYDEEYLLKVFKKHVFNNIKVNKKLLTYDDIDRIKTLPSSSVYNRHFKSIENLYKAIGIDKDKFNNDILEEDMKNKYIKIRNILGRTPSSRDLDRFSRNSNEYYGVTTYLIHFKNIISLQKMMGDEIKDIARDMSEEEMLEALVRLKDDIGIVPTQNDLKQCPYTPSSSTYRNTFGSFVNAIIKTGMKPRSNKHKLITPNGNQALSGYEYKFLLMLEKYNIKFSKEDRYSDYIKGFKKKYKFDFILHIDNNKYFIEIFGITGNENYDLKTKEKIQICNENKIKLIPLYGEDLAFKNIDEIKEMIDTKIKNINNEGEFEWQEKQIEF